MDEEIGTSVVCLGVLGKSIEEIDTLLLNLQGPPTAPASRRSIAEKPTSRSSKAATRTCAPMCSTRDSIRAAAAASTFAELPLLYAKGRHPRPPEVRFPDPDVPATPSGVRQSKLEAAPFLRSIPVYRYAH
jgi:hypothetical protein